MTSDVFAERGRTVPTVAVLDLDGTLVDSVYVHVLAWRAAFADVGLDVPAVRLHHLIGVGGDRLVAEAAGQAAEDAMGEELRSRHPDHLDRLFHLITPTRGALRLLEGLQEHQVDVRLASSSDGDLTDRLLGVVEGAHRLIGTKVTGDDAESSKPSGELIGIALGDADPSAAVVIGDAVWDVAAARDAGVACVGVLTGGTPARELLDAGAVAVHDDPEELAVRLESTGSVTA